MKYKEYKTLISTYFSETVYQDIVKKWCGEYRYYHNTEHLNFIISKLEELTNITEKEFGILLLVAFFHDVIYIPDLNNNEEQSIEYFNNVASKYDIINDETKIIISNIIMDTKLKKRPTNSLSAIFWDIDNSITQGSFSELLKWEEKIFKEFQYISYDKYKIGRIDFLKTINGNDDNINDLIEYVKNRIIKVGIYTGSFNPFHIGHYDIINKSMKLFDKIIIAYGNNPDKLNNIIKYPKCLLYLETLEYSTLITDLLDEVSSYGCDVTLIRGIRSCADLSYESNQLSFIEDIRPNTSIIMIPCDKKFDYISSSAIKNLQKFNENAAKKYLVE